MRRIEIGLAIQGLRSMSASHPKLRLIANGSFRPIADTRHVLQAMTMNDRTKRRRRIGCLFVALGVPLSLSLFDATLWSAFRLQCDHGRKVTIIDGTALTAFETAVDEVTTEGWGAEARLRMRGYT